MSNNDSGLLLRKIWRLATSKMVMFMRDQRYFEFARPVGNTATVLPDKTRRTLTLHRGGQSTLRMVELRGMGQAG